MSPWQRASEEDEEEEEEQEEDVQDLPTGLLPCSRLAQADQQVKYWPPTEAPSEDRPFTTVMLRNLPNNYSRTMVLQMLNDNGFTGCYDFFYLPMDFKSTACLGYAFVNLIDARTAAVFWKTFDGFSNWLVPSKKVCSVCWSGPHQGLVAHIERYRNSPVMHPSVPDEYKPLAFMDGVRVVFPAPTKAPRAPRVRHHREQRIRCSAAADA
jgi:hypothetical protein